MAYVFDSVEQVDELLKAYRECLKTIALGKSFTMPDGQSFDPGDQAEVRRTLTWLSTQKSEMLSHAGPKVNRGRPKR